MARKADGAMRIVTDAVTMADFCQGRFDDELMANHAGRFAMSVLEVAKFLELVGGASKSIDSAIQLFLDIEIQTLNLDKPMIFDIAQNRAEHPNIEMSLMATWLHAIQMKVPYWSISSAHKPPSTVNFRLIAP